MMFDVSKAAMQRSGSHRSGRARCASVGGACSAGTGAPGSALSESFRNAIRHYVSHGLDGDHGIDACPPPQKRTTTFRHLRLTWRDDSAGLSKIWYPSNICISLTSVKYSGAPSGSCLRPSWGPSGMYTGMHPPAPNTAAHFYERDTAGPL